MDRDTFHASPMADGLRSMVRQKIRAGQLPNTAGKKLYAGAGTDTPCTGCGVPTKVAGTEFEIVNPTGTTIVCRPCYFVWSQEIAG